MRAIPTTTATPMKRPARLPCPWTASTIAPTARIIPATTNAMRAAGDRARRKRGAAAGRRVARAARRLARLFIPMRPESRGAVQARGRVRERRVARKTFRSSLLFILAWPEALPCPHRDAPWPLLPCLRLWANGEPLSLGLSLLRGKIVDGDVQAFITVAVGCVYLSRLSLFSHSSIKKLGRKVGSGGPANSVQRVVKAELFEQLNVP